MKTQRQNVYSPYCHQNVYSPYCYQNVYSPYCYQNVYSPYCYRMYILHTVLYTFPLVLTRRICASILSRASWIGDHFLYSHYLSVWFKSDTVRRNCRSQSVSGVKGLLLISVFGCLMRCSVYESKQLWRGLKTSVLLVLTAAASQWLFFLEFATEPMPVSFSWKEKSLKKSSH